MFDDFIIPESGYDCETFYENDNVTTVECDSDEPY